MDSRSSLMNFINTIERFSQRFKGKRKKKMMQTREHSFKNQAIHLKTEEIVFIMEVTALFSILF